MFESDFPSTHLVAPQDPQIREKIQFCEREYVCYVISGPGTEIKCKEVSFDPTDFMQRSVPFSLVFTSKIEPPENPVIQWFVFHHKSHDDNALDAILELSGYGYRIVSYLEPVLRRAANLERTIHTVCSRAYARSICYKDYWPLYPRFVYLLYLMREKINRGDVDRTSSESSDEVS